MPKTGATRYQKFLKSEKRKTKLKAKNKELPRGTNVTKTNFKVKKIVLKEQLKKHGDNEALSMRKLNVKELLSRLNHFNTRTQIDSLDGLKDLITNHPEVLQQNLGQLINGVTACVLNIEKVVRQESLKILHLILTNAPVENIEPFFDIMSTYMRSAMTHIDHRIQEDSLLFLDILLLTTPNKIAQDIHKVLPNFLDMISKLRVDSKAGRMLTVNLGSQITSGRWRVKVLQRLKDFLNKFIKHSDIQSTNERDKRIELFDESKLNYPIWNPVYTTVCSLSCLKPTNNDSAIIDKGEKFKSYIELLMPLLFETWLEVCPSINQTKNMETVISEDAAILLRHILEVVLLLFILVQNFDNKDPSSRVLNVFIQNYQKAFSQHFVQSLPFVTNIRPKQIKSDNSPFEDTITDPKLVKENLIICNLFIIFNPNVNLKIQKSEISSVLNYIEKNCNHNTKEDISDQIINIANKIFSNEITAWNKTSTVLNELFRKIISVYFHKDVCSIFKQKIFALLCKVAVNDKLSHFHTCDAYEKWLHNLPEILLQESVIVQTVKILHQFSVHNNQTFNMIVKPKLLPIIENLPKINISDSINDVNSYHTLYSLLYWIKCWSDEPLNLLEKQLLEGVYKNDHGKFVFDTLKFGSIKAK